MNARTLIASGIAVAALAAWIVVQRDTHRRLIADLVSLTARHRQLAELQSQIPALEASIARLQAARQQQIAAAARRAAIAAAENSGPAAGFIAADDLKNVGDDTMKDAFETYVWALEHQDVKTLAGLLKLRPNSQAKVQAIFDGLSAGDQARYGTPEQMFALMYLAQYPQLYFSAMRIVSDDPAPSATPVQFQPLETQYQYPNGAVTNHNYYLAQGADGNWQMWMQPYQVNRILKQFGQPDAQPQTVP